MPFRFDADLAAEPGEAGLVALFARCADAVVEYDAATGRARACFERTAPSLVDAVVSAVRDLDAAGLAAAVVRGDGDAAVFEAVTIALRLRALAPRVGRIQVIRSLAGELPCGG